MSRVASPLPGASSINADWLDETDDPNAIYSNFLNRVNEIQKKMMKMNESVSDLSLQISSTSFDAVVIFDPKIPFLLHNVETQGAQMDRLVAAAQDMKKQLSDLAGEADKNKPVDYWKKEIEQLGLTDPTVEY